MMDRTLEIVKLLQRKRLPVSNEAYLQNEIEALFRDNGIPYDREYRLDDTNRPDFFCEGVAVEVKIKGAKKAIYKQCERYCFSPRVRSLILITNRTFGFPPSIEGKPCYVVKLGLAWL